MLFKATAVETTVTETTKSHAYCNISFFFFRGLRSDLKQLHSGGWGPKLYPSINQQTRCAKSALCAVLCETFGIHFRPYPNVFGNKLVAILLNTQGISVAAAAAATALQKLLIKVNCKLSNLMKNVSRFALLNSGESVSQTERLV